MREDRYAVRWCNGYWRVFDHTTYSPVDMTRDVGTPWLSLQSIAIEATAWFNANQ